MSVTAFIQARLSSKRLPGKVLLPVAGKPMIQWIADRAAPAVKTVVVGTSLAHEDARLVSWCEGRGIPVLRHEVDDIVGRMHQVLQAYPADYLLRLWGDSPLICPEMIRDAVSKMEKESLDFFSTGYPALTYPAGIDFELYRASLINELAARCKDSFYREFPMEYLKKNGHLKLAGTPSPEDLHQIELSVDYPEDLALMEHLLGGIAGRSGPLFPYSEIRDFIQQNRQLFEKNSNLPRNIEFKQKLETKRDNS
jgi:spore coat polysaccharide biosynthesis protein SpsF (cytidylyltransferase family)